MKRKVRRLNIKNLLIVMGCFVLLIFVMMGLVNALITNINYNKIKKYDYLATTLKLVSTNKVINEVASHKYSKTLDESINKSNFNFDKISNYFKIDYVDYEGFGFDLNELMNKDYSVEEIKGIFKHLTTAEISLLAKNNYSDELFNYYNLSNFNYENLERYIKYQGNNPELSFSDIVTRVNINLDYDDYTQVENSNLEDDILILINKHYKLPSDYRPTNLQYIDSKFSEGNRLLRNDAKKAFDILAQAAKDSNLVLLASSAYRSYDYQNNLYNRYVRDNGQIEAEKFSARAGHSEHQSGLAVDVSSGTSRFDDFEKTNEYAWLKNNAHKYGWIIRYPKPDIESTNDVVIAHDITRYMFESWHLRYVGVTAATYIYENDITFDEYYSLFVQNKTTE